MLLVCGTHLYHSQFRVEVVLSFYTFDTKNMYARSKSVSICSTLHDESRSPDTIMIMEVSDGIKIHFMKSC